MTHRGCLIGCGFFARNHMHAWADLPGADEGHRRQLRRGQGKLKHEPADEQGGGRARADGGRHGLQSCHAVGDGPRDPP